VSNLEKKTKKQKKEKRKKTKKGKKQRWAVALFFSELPASIYECVKIEIEDFYCVF
jgi:hypothetical protein